MFLNVVLLHVCIHDPIDFSTMFVSIFVLQTSECNKTLAVYKYYTELMQLVHIQNDATYLPLMSVCCIFARTSTLFTNISVHECMVGHYTLCIKFQVHTYYGI